MDSAFQASIGLIIDLKHVSDKPVMPFVLESARIFSGCTNEMRAWVRLSNDAKPQDRTVKLDIDLCDQHGNICVQMQGLTLRRLAPPHHQEHPILFLRTLIPLNMARPSILLFMSSSSPTF
jgi:hypothetical protein